MEFTIRPFDPATDIPARVNLYNSIYPEAPTTISQSLEWERLRPSDLISQRLVAVRNQQVIAVAFCNHKRNADSMDYLINCSVAHEARGQGIGTDLLRRGIQFAQDQNAVRVFAYLRDDDPASMRFAEAHGFSRLHHGFEVALELESFDANRLQELNNFHFDAGVILTDLETWGDTLEHRRALYDLSNEVMRDSPDEPFEARFEDFLRWLERNTYFASGVRLAMDANENLIGFSWLMFDAETSLADNWGTGVKREFRRQGLAWGLKLECVRWALDRGAKRLLTGNNETNVGMRMINQRLGFERQLGTWEMELRFQAQPASKAGNV
jgi:RimJ/RimL family protein N-acetyltransferase